MDRIFEFWNLMSVSLCVWSKYYIFSNWEEFKILENTRFNVCFLRPTGAKSNHTPHRSFQCRLRTYHNRRLSGHIARMSSIDRNVCINNRYIKYLYLSLHGYISVTPSRWWWWWRDVPWNWGFLSLLLSVPLTPELGPVVFSGKAIIRIINDNNKNNRARNVSLSVWRVVCRLDTTNKPSYE